jgi:hypothetical protein
MRKLIRKILREDESNDMDWIENTNPVPLRLPGMVMPRRGEQLVCLPGFQDNQYAKTVGVPALPYGGAGYEEGKVITVQSISYSVKWGYIIWPREFPASLNGRTDGIFSFALARI